MSKKYKKNWKLFWHFIGFLPASPIYRTPIWDPHLGPPFGTAIWDRHLGPPFGTPIWDPHLGPPFGTPIWDPHLGHPFGTHIFNYISWFTTSHQLVWDPDFLATSHRV
jgi:hypothetical protein